MNEDIVEGKPTATAAGLMEKLDDFGGHMPAVIVLNYGTDRESTWTVGSIDDGTIDGTTVVRLHPGEKIQ